MPYLAFLALHMDMDRGTTQFLAHLALHRRVVGRPIEREEPFVMIVHVPADADASLGHEPLLARLAAKCAPGST